VREEEGKKRRDATNLAELVEVGLPRLGIHGHSLMDGVGSGVDVPCTTMKKNRRRRVSFDLDEETEERREGRRTRVDDQASVQTLSGTSELRQNHRSMSLFLGSDILVRAL